MAAVGRSTTHLTTRSPTPLPTLFLDQVRIVIIDIDDDDDDFDDDDNDDDDEDNACLLASTGGSRLPEAERNNANGNFNNIGLQGKIIIVMNDDIDDIDDIDDKTHISRKTLPS